MNGLYGLLCVRLPGMNSDDVECEHVIQDDFSFFPCSKPSNYFYKTNLTGIYTGRCDKHSELVNSERYVQVTYDEYVASQVHDS